MEKIKQIFSDPSGQLSSMRLNSFIAVVVSVGLSVYAIIAGKIPDPTTLILGWLSMGFIPKAAQSFAERKNASN
jgi:hypothetical protein